MVLQLQKLYSTGGVCLSEEINQKGMCRRYKLAGGLLSVYKLRWLVYGVCAGR